MRSLLAFAAAALVASAPLARAAEPAQPGYPASGGNPYERPLPWLGVRLGGLIAASSAGGNAPSGGGGGAWALFDAGQFLADVSADLFFGPKTHFIALGLGAYYPLSRANVVPYLGGGLKVGWTKFGGDGAFGMIPFASLGVLFGREGYVQLRAEIAWWVAASREERKDLPGALGTRATGPMGTFGIAF